MNKGFTLVELLAVLIILSIIATITLFATGGILKDSKESLSANQKARLEQAAEEYYLYNSTATYVCVSTLIDEGYVESEVVYDPKDRTEMKGYVVITVTGNKVRFKYDDEDTSLCE